jgi:hypothetical protein
VTSQKVSEKLATASGLHLGMTAAEVKKILGQPCIQSNDSIQYAFDYRYLLPADERQRLKNKGDSDADEPFDWFGTMQNQIPRFEGLLHRDTDWRRSVTVEIPLQLKHCDRERDAAPSDQTHCGDACEAHPPRKCLLSQHQHGDSCDPVNVHDADDEQQAHQRPATAEA